MKAQKHAAPLGLKMGAKEEGLIYEKLRYWQTRTSGVLTEEDAHQIMEDMQKRLHDLK